MTLIYLVAGEASGDALAARLMARLRERRPDLAFAGVGGERMAEQGLESLFPMGELAIMGLMEVLPSLRRLARRLDETARDAAARRPALLVTVDSPGFALRLAARLRPGGLRVVHYVAPQVWAWRPGRLRGIARRVDRILALLPFEPPFFEAAGVPVTFVGHPVLESGAASGDAARFRAEHRVAPEERVVLVMPGSRRGEVSRHMPLFGEALRRLSARHPGLRPAVPVASTVGEAVLAGLADWPGRPIALRGEAARRNAFAAADAGLVKSGTSSLEAAAGGVPMVVGYRVNPLTAAVVRRLVRVPHASLVNLLAERAVIPEYLQERCEPAGLAAGLARLLEEPEAAAAQRAGFAEALARLSPPGGLRPSEAAAEAVLAELGRG